MFWMGSHTINSMKTNRKQKGLRFITALLSTLLLGWYSLPSVYRVLHLPDCVDESVSLSAPALSSRAESARFVRESGDERIREQKTTLRLFGMLPIRSVTVQSGGRTVTLGGQAVGIVLKTEGVQIVGIGSIAAESGKVSPAQRAGLREGDMILAVNGSPVTDAASLTNLMAKAQGSCTLSCLRDGEAFTAELTPERDRDGTVRIGAWVRDSTSGIGTLSFYDSATGRFAALGHGVTDVDTGKLLSPATGFLSEARITALRKGTATEAGELIGVFSTDPADAIADVESNSAFGIAGQLFEPASGETLPIGSPDSAHLGDAVIRSTIDGEGVREYRVRIIRVDVQSAPELYGMMIEIVDPTLLERADGIVQGMSGSPLIQDGRLIGVVTHVFLNRSARGYCLYAAWMEEKLLPPI